MTVRNASGTPLSVLLILFLGFFTPAPAQPPGPAGASSGAVANLDLSGPPDNSPLVVDESGASPFVSSPPQTVEGTVASLDPKGAWVEVQTRDRLVKLGLPINVPYVRSGNQNATFGEIRVGDSIYATVVNGKGPRAVYVVTDPPFNPWITWLGVPLLLLGALWIRRADRQGDGERVDKAMAKAQEKTK